MPTGTLGDLFHFARVGRDAERKVRGAGTAPLHAAQIPAGDRLRIPLPGGGGYGDPRKRPAEKVAEDVVHGLVSVEKARELYGVALTADLKVDEAETARLRMAVAAE
jgi:N-methylhydantoinase B